MPLSTYDHGYFPKLGETAMTAEILTMLETQ
jgi:hypothetical protein